MDDFPDFDSFQDFRGKTIRFRYDLIDAGNIYSLRAREVTKSEYAREFSAYDSASPWNALCKLRKLIPQELNTRYFTKDEGDAFGSMNFDHFRGSIATDSEARKACLVVDGKKMSMTDLERVLSMHEGWQIEVRITEE
ncbi:MAG: hypothetical protein A4E62_01303 [Syntrophorhabdus sp. PtaU1.Bin002]|nr:MAG: hypothetical protein A4E62_01303 [Syntrophorhabdus sp. PtaU1.Bin002]